MSWSFKVTATGGGLQVTELDGPVPDGDYLVAGSSANREEQLGLGFTHPDGTHGHRVNLLVSRVPTTGGSQ